MTADALAAVMAEWSNPRDSYAVRRAFLLSGGGLNHSHLLNVNEVVNDAGNVLLGGADHDWFWAQPLKGDQMPNRIASTEKLGAI